MDTPNPVVDGRPARRRILVLLAHPSIGRSAVIGPMARTAASVDGVTLVDLYAHYPDLHVDAALEQERLRSHDVLVFLHPLYWYSTPAILKQWQDLVLEHGFAYGHEGTALAGKIFLSAVSAGGPDHAYRAGGDNRFTLSELLRPLEQMAALCGMRYLPPFALYGARAAATSGRLDAHLAQWRQLLVALRDDPVDPAHFGALATPDAAPALAPMPARPAAVRPEPEAP